MGDYENAVHHARAAMADGKELSDACVRVIASLYHGGQGSNGHALASTGWLPTEMVGAICRELFGDYNTLSEDEKLLYDMLGTYALVRIEEGRVGAPVEGWSSLWL